jgi:aryl carrier-like protein
MEGLKETLHGMVADVIGIEPDELDDDQPINNQGMESVDYLDLMSRLKRQLGIHVGALYDQPGLTVSSLVGICKAAR